MLGVLGLQQLQLAHSRSQEGGREGAVLMGLGRFTHLTLPHCFPFRFPTSIKFLFLN